MTDAQLQGLSCIALGTATAIGAYAYSGALAVTVAEATFPFLLIPVLAGGYAIGCSVGSTTGPGVYWLYARLSGG